MPRKNELKMNRIEARLFRTARVRFGPQSGH
jgi:hypothetical protein